jgi:hypothetical protein
MRALPAVLILLLGWGFCAPPLRAQHWEAAAVGAWQTQTSSTYWDQGSASAWGVRGAWLAPRDGASRLRLEAAWTAPARWTTRGTDGSQAALRAQSVAVGVARETWFMEDRFCFSVALDLRNTWLESTQGPAPRMTNHLPQLWMRLGVGVRAWAFNRPDRLTSDEPIRYALLRLELGEAAPRGPSATDELLPQREVTLAAGVRF